jgi:DNA-directed RNA polymerase subunit RPC12/RpoP
MVDTTPVPCSCYRCAEPVEDYDDEGRRYVVNNVHGRLAACPDCGRAMTEYEDHGTKGVYRCWWCNDRAASPGAVPPP